MAEVAVPFGAATGTAMTTLQQYRDRLRPTQLDMVDGATVTSGPGGPGTDTALKVSISGTTISVANGGALVNGFRYDLTGGPMILTPAAPGAANIFGVVCLTLDTTHNPIVYLRIVSGTSGGGLASVTLTNSQTGVWDFPIAHFERQPGGQLVNLKDRRKWADGDGGIRAADDVSGTLNAGWFPPAPRVAQQIQFMPSGTVWTWDGFNWARPVSPGMTSVTGEVNTTPQDPITSTAYIAGTDWCSASMVAPPSGQISVTIFARGANGTAGQTILLAFECRVTSSTGSVFLAASDNRSVQAADHGPGYGGHGDSWRHIMTGLTPGTNYYFRTMQRVSSGSGSFGRRSILLEAVH